MAKRDVALIIHEGVQCLDVAGPLDVFAEANGFLDDDDGYHCTILATTTAPLRASNGMTLTAHHRFEEAARIFHTVLVAGGPGLPGRPEDGEMSLWLKEWGVKAERYGSICTGAFALGHAGLLDGQVVTTHWQNADGLAKAFPAARVDHDRIFARDGRLVTSAGVTAGIDLALALVGEDHGERVALACAKRLVVVAQRQGGQSQFSPLLLPASDPTTPLGKVHAYVMANLTQPFPVERLASIAGASVRTMARLFVKELGVTPHDFIESIRLDRARNMLEATDFALKVIAFDCGFGSAEQMRSVFQRRLGLSPLRYRKSFRVPRASERVPV